MEYISQLGNGWMLYKDDKGLYGIEETGYPYPDTKDRSAVALSKFFGGNDDVTDNAKFYMQKVLGVFNLDISMRLKRETIVKQVEVNQEMVLIATYNDWFCFNCKDIDDFRGNGKVKEFCFGKGEVNIVVMHKSNEFFPTGYKECKEEIDVAVFAFCVFKDTIYILGNSLLNLRTDLMAVNNLLLDYKFDICFNEYGISDASYVSNYIRSHRKRIYSALLELGITDELRAWFRKAVKWGIFYDIYYFDSSTMSCLSDGVFKFSSDRLKIFSDKELNEYAPIRLFMIDRGEDYLVLDLSRLLPVNNDIWMHIWEEPSRDSWFDDMEYKPTLIGKDVFEKEYVDYDALFAKEMLILQDVKHMCLGLSFQPYGVKPLTFYLFSGLKAEYMHEEFTDESGYCCVLKPFKDWSDFDLKLLCGCDSDKLFSDLKSDCILLGLRFMLKSILLSRRGCFAKAKKGSLAGCNWHYSYSFAGGDTEILVEFKR